MELKIIGEYGYDQALYGLGLSYGLTSNIIFEEYIKNITLKDKLRKISFGLKQKDAGHNKFLESIQVWLYIKAPRFLFSEIDTYRVGETKQSESTMHTLLKNTFTQNMFESPIPEDILILLESYRVNQNFNMLKNILPEGFLQRRIWNVNYKTLRNIISQRRNHKLEQWKFFCDYLMNNLEHKEYFTDLNY